MFRSEFDGTSHWSIRAWISFLVKGGGQKKRFQYCLNPYSSEHFLYFRAIQGHSGGTLVDPTLPNNVPLPDDFAEYIYHVGNAHDMHSIIQCGLILGGESLKRDRHAVFFTAVNPMYTCQYQEDFQYDLDKPRTALYKNTTQQNSVYWCNLTVTQTKGLQFSQTRFNTITFFNTLRAIRIEKTIFMKTGEELYSKVFEFPRLPRTTVLTSKLHHGRRGLSDPKAGTSADHQSKRSEEYEETRSAKFEETRSGNIDFRIQGLPHSTVQKEDYDCRNGEETDPPI